MPTLSFPKWQGGGSPGANLPTLHYIHGLIALAASPTIVQGKGFTCSKTSTGIFRITLNQACPRILPPLGAYILAAATTEARFLRGWLLPVDSNGYVEAVFTDAAGAVADPNVANFLGFNIPVMLTRQSVV